MRASMVNKDKNNTPPPPPAAAPYQLLGLLVWQAWLDHHLLPPVPVGWGGHRVLVGKQQRVHGAEQLHRAGVGQGVLLAFWKANH